MAEIVDLSEIYSAEYHAIAGERGEKQYPAKQDMARALDEMFRPKRVIDVGCGRGWWLEYWALNRPEVEIVGLDGCAELIKRNNQCHESIRDKIHSCDLRQPMWWRPWFEEPWDLVLCVEVAEHLPESYARQLVGGLRVLGNRIFFSAARPGQKGVGHTFCRDKRYWIEQFAYFGFQPDMALWRKWHDRLQHRGKRYGRNIRRNAILFTRG